MKMKTICMEESRNLHVEGEERIFKKSKWKKETRKSKEEKDNERDKWETKYRQKVMKRERKKMRM